jgi:hypothetical protein
MNLIMTVVLVRHPSNFVLQKSKLRFAAPKTFAIVDCKSLFPDDPQKLPLRVEKPHGQASTTQPKG